MTRTTPRDGESRDGQGGIRPVPPGVDNPPGKAKQDDESCSGGDGVLRLTSQPLSDGHSTMATATDTDDTEEPTEHKGKFFGEQRNDGGEVNTKLLPDNLTEMQENILTVAIQNPSMTQTDVHERVIERFYDGDEDAAPSYSTVHRTLKKHNNIERPDGRKQQSPKAKTGDSESDEGETADEPMELTRGMHSFSGNPLDMSEQYLSERPVKGEPEPAAETEDSAEGESTSSDGISQSALVAALTSLARDGADNDTLREFIDRLDTSELPEPSEEELLTAIETLAASDVDSAVIIQHLAAGVQKVS